MALAAALFALGLAHPSISLSGLASSAPAKAGKVKCQHVSAQPTKHWIVKKAWPLIRWERGRPEPIVFRSYKQKLRCARSGSHRAAIRRSWKKAKRAYKEHRAYMLMDPWEREWDKLSADDQAWAIDTGECESGNDPTTDTGNGFEGAFQWVRSTWYAAGGSGSPVDASWYEQAVRAVRWRNIAGDEQWPNCGD